MAVDRRRIRHKKDRLRQLRAFCHVASSGSITRAAEFLELSAAAVSLHVRHLEHEMGTMLFERAGRGVRLNAAGERLYNLARPLVQRMDSLSADYIDQLCDRASGTIHFGANPAIAVFVMAVPLHRFQAVYPAMRLKVRTCSVADGVQRLLDGELEFVVGELDPALRNRRNIVYHHVANYDYVLITAPDHSLAGREGVSLEELAAHSVVVPTSVAGKRQPEDVGVRVFGVDWDNTIEAGRWEVVKGYVEQGLGASIVPSFCVNENDALSAIPLRDGVPGGKYGVITRRGKALTKAARDLVELVAPEYREQ